MLGSVQNFLLFGAMRQAALYGKPRCKPFRAKACFRIFLFRGATGFTSDSSCGKNVLLA
jgi:hypothetical protein